MSASVELRGLGLRHGDTTALDGVDLVVAAGSVTAVLGASGSGKSTLLRLVAGLDTPTEGSVLLDGVDQAGVAAERRGAVLVSQRPQLFGHLSVLDNAAFPARVAGRSRRTARAAAREHLELVHLGAHATRRVGGLSGGEAQRLALARALGAAPRVLLLDEPFSALDSTLRADMHELVERVQAEHALTVLLVTHDQLEAARLASTIAVLSHGRLLQHGGPAELYQRPGSLQVHRSMGGLTEVTGTVRAGVHHSALGALRLPGTPPAGPGVLVLRHESTQLTAAGDGDTNGVVAARRHNGARTQVTVRVGSARVVTETAFPHGAAVGDEVGLRIPLAGRWVVPCATEHIANRAGPTNDRRQEP